MTSLRSSAKQVRGKIHCCCGCREPAWQVAPVQYKLRMDSYVRYRTYTPVECSESGAVDWEHRRYSGRLRITIFSLTRVCWLTYSGGEEIERTLPTLQERRAKEAQAAHEIHAEFACGKAFARDAMSITHVDFLPCTISRSVLKAHRTRNCRNNFSATMYPSRQSAAEATISRHVRDQAHAS